MDEAVRKKLVELVEDGVTSVQEMRRHLSFFVERELMPEEHGSSLLSNRRFYPSVKDIRNAMYTAATANRYSKIDQENLLLTIESWQTAFPNDRFFVRPYAEIEEPVQVSDDQDTVQLEFLSEKQHFLFIHQTEWQSRLLERYGQEMTFLDATYRTSKYALPLFFVCVKTNVDYCVVGTFITQDETSASILEALTILKAWNENWKPRFFLTDYCDAEINAIEAAFDG